LSILIAKQELEYYFLYGVNKLETSCFLNILFISWGTTGWKVSKHAELPKECEFYTRSSSHSLTLFYMHAKQTIRFILEVAVHFCTHLQKFFHQISDHFILLEPTITSTASLLLKREWHLTLLQHTL